MTILVVPPSGTVSNRTVIATFGSDTVTFTRDNPFQFFLGGFSYVDFIGRFVFKVQGPST